MIAPRYITTEAPLCDVSQPIAHTSRIHNTPPIIIQTNSPPMLQINIVIQILTTKNSIANIPIFLPPCPASLPQPSSQRTLYDIIVDNSTHKPSPWRLVGRRHLHTTSAGRVPLALSSASSVPLSILFQQRRRSSIYNILATHTHARFRLSIFPATAHIKAAVEVTPKTINSNNKTIHDSTLKWLP